MPVRWIALTLAGMSAVVCSSRALAQELVPVGPQFQVNTYTTSNQQAPAVAVDGAGNFVVAWTSDGSGGSDASALSIQAQRYDSTGTPQGGQFQVNTYTTGVQESVDVAADGVGNFVVVWKSEGSAGSDTDNVSIQGQRYDSAGTPDGGQFQVNTYTTGSQLFPAVGTDGAGNFLVAWRSAGSAGSDNGTSIQAQRYHSSGVPQGGQFQVNTYTTGTQSAPAVAGDDAGNFVVVWESNGSAGSDTSSYSIQGQRYDGAGTPQGGEFQVNTYTSGLQTAPDVAADDTGSFVVVWNSIGGAGSDTSGYSVQGQRYDGAGNPQGEQFQVNTYTLNNQDLPAVTADDIGSFVVVWQSLGSAGPDAEDTGIVGQRYDAAGAPQGGEFQVNTYTTGFQQYPHVAADPAGNLVVVWQSSEGDGSDTSSGFSTQGQRFAVPTTTSTTSTTLPTTGLLPGQITIIKPGAASFVAKPAKGEAFTLPTSDPVAVGGSLRVSDLGTTAGADTYPLPAGSSWKGLGKPAGSKGYKYAGAGTPGDPCKTVLVKSRLIKAVCKGTGVTLTPPFAGDVGIILSVGTTDRYCAQFGGKSVKNDAKLTKRKKAPAPGACPP